MTERPIAFSTQMVKAILAGRKTMTRRVVDPQPEQMGEVGGEIALYWNGGGSLLRIGHEVGYIHTNLTAARRIMENAAPYKPGMRLWVREAFRIPKGLDSMSPAEAIAYKSHPTLQYSTTYIADEPEGGMANVGRYRHARFMPRSLSRIDLVVKDVRVERLQAIVGTEALAEGAPSFSCYGPDCPPSCNQTGCFGAVEWFAELWNSLNGHRGCAWAANPFVYVISFERRK